MRSSSIRILYLSGYSHLIHHRKVELLADAENLEILNINGLDCDRKAGRYPSANGERSYELVNLPTAYLLKNDVHRGFYWPPRFRLRQFQPHLIYCEHEQESLMALEAALMRNLFSPGVPLILYTWQNILRQRNLAVRLISSATLRAAQHIFSASAEGIHVLRRQGYTGGATVVQQMGVDPRYFHPMSVADLRTQLGLTDTVIGYVGRLVPEKGIDLLLEAVQQMPAPCQLLLIGDGPEKAALQSLAQARGIGDRCLWVDAVPFADVARYLNLLDILVLPSRTTPNWKEQFGRVLVEAMACQVTVVGSDSGAIPEVIGDRKRIFAEDDQNGLAKILAELVEKPQLRIQSGQEGFKRAMENYTTERLAEKMLAVWQQVAKAHSFLDLKV